MSKKNLNLKEREDKEYNPENYMGLGMCLGALSGSAVMVVMAMFGQTVWGGTAVGIGLILGMVIGMSIKRKR